MGSATGPQGADPPVTKFLSADNVAGRGVE
jgi:hypothetical protein